MDWSDFNGSSMYDAQAVPSALCSLMDLEDSNMVEDVGNKLINVLGSDHAGVYYPVVFKALDYIVEMANNTDHEACKLCALAVLNDLY
ncbi:MAG: hypothetical protein HZT40_01565 [Candidatus Thiothrix singaporensis]|uniref:Uncharacterized protein n=1 Tax=Candidatus Thiothrix singaporensis TaxID=2799669 RepID=A0A7L6AN50_9GAMM|nr:MAG: hypothetical protein HZT40_01565 [Candidatus Thiothrix singaporensis]